MNQNDFNIIEKELDRLIQTGNPNGICQDMVEFLHSRVPHYNWVGFYWVEGDELVLGEWDGPAATQHVRIPIEQGICGLSAGRRETVIVQDVREDSRYLACFLNTRSEIVIPIIKDGRTIGVLDIDSDEVDPFTSVDKIFLENLARKVAGVTNLK